MGRKTASAVRAMTEVLVLGCLSPPVLAAPPAQGLIVRLQQDARPTAWTYRAEAWPPGHGQAERLAVARHAADRRRLEGVIAQVAGPAHPSIDTRPAGRAAHVLRWTSAHGDAALMALKRELQARPEVESVELDTMEQPLSAATGAPTPSDPLFARQTWMGAPEAATAGLPDIQNAWKRSTGNPISGGAFVPVAVLDTGILAAHPDLAERILPGYDFVSRTAFSNDGDGRDGDPSDPGDWVSASDAASGALQGCAVADSSWHGTLIAGQIAAATNNNTGVAGIDWEGRVVPVRIAGRCGALLSDIIDGMRWAGGLPVLNAQGAPIPVNPNPVRIISLSFGDSGACGSALQETIDELTAIGVVVVAASGNGSGAVGRPANCKGVIGVTALMASGVKASYANFGPELSIATAGGDQSATDGCSAALQDGGIYTTSHTGKQGPDSGTLGYAAVDGTSFAAPVVAGTIALMLAINPQLSAGEIAAGLKATARPHVLAPQVGDCSAANKGRCACTTATCGAGVLDAAQALAYAADPGSYVPHLLAPAAVPAELLDNCHGSGSTSSGGLSASDVANTTAQSGADSGGGAFDAFLLLLLLATIPALRAARRG